MSWELEKYTLKNNIDNMISSLNQAKQMLENAKTQNEIENAIVYTEYVVSSFNSELKKSHDKVKTR